MCQVGIDKSFVADSTPYVGVTWSYVEVFKSYLGVKKSYMQEILKQLLCRRCLTYKVEVSVLRMSK